MTQEVQRTLAELTAITDPKKRLAMAEDARRRLLDWSASTYGYRAADVQELARLFDEVICELRAAAGERQFSLDLRDGHGTAARTAAAAADADASRSSWRWPRPQAADSEDDRLAILRAASALAAGDPAPGGFARASDARHGSREQRPRRRTPHSRRTSAAQAGGGAQEGRRRRVDRARWRRLRTRDQRTGRPPAAGGGRALTVELDEMMAPCARYREALDHYTARAPQPARLRARGPADA